MTKNAQNYSKNSFAFLGKNRFFQKMIFFIFGSLIFQERFCKRLEKMFFSQNLKSSISQLSYALSNVKKYLKLALLI